MPTQAIPEISAAARLVHARLAKCKVGDVVPYSELSELAKCDVRKKRGAMNTARNLARRAENMIFGCIVGVGLKRLDDTGIASEVSRDFRKVHRACNRGLRKAEKVEDLSSIAPPERTRFLATSSCLSAIAHATKETAIKRISVSVDKTQARLSLEETINAFR